MSRESKENSAKVRIDNEDNDRMEMLLLDQQKSDPPTLDVDHNAAKYSTLQAEIAKHE